MFPLLSILPHLFLLLCHLYGSPIDGEHFAVFPLRRGQITEDLFDTHLEVLVLIRGRYFRVITVLLRNYPYG